MQRLSGLDASFLYFETRSQLLHVCGLVIVDPSTMKGGYSFDAMKAELGRRIKFMPGFRRKLHDSVLNLDHPVWVEARHLDLDHHLHHIAVPGPGGREELSELVAHLAGLPMDRSLPLWEMYVIEGLASGEIAIFAKMHHSTVDGVTGSNMMSQLCGLSPDAPDPDKDLEKTNAGDAGMIELAVSGALSYASRPLKLASLLPNTLAVVPNWVSRSRRGKAMPAPFSAPRTSFNGTITGHRSISYTNLSLTDVKYVKDAFGTTVNDVVLAIVAGALRSYLEQRKELPPTSLIGMVPMSVHAADDRPGTNRVSGMFSRLFTEVDDSVERLLLLRDSNQVAKEHQDALDANLLTDWAQFAAPSVFGSAVRMYSHLRLAEKHPVVHNLVISNVPGPPFPLYFLGAKITKMFPLGPVFHGAGLNATVMSLDGELNVGFIACKELAPDLWPLISGVENSLAELVEAAKQLTDSERKAYAQLRDKRRKTAGRDINPQAASPEDKAESDPVVVTKAQARKAAKKTAAKKKPAAKKAPAKKAAAKKTAAKKAAAKKTAAAKKAPAKKVAAKKTTPAKKPSSTQDAGSDSA